MWLLLQERILSCSRLTLLPKQAFESAKHSLNQWHSQAQADLQTAPKSQQHCLPCSFRSRSLEVYSYGPHLPQLLHCLNCSYRHIPNQDFCHFPDARGKFSSLVFSSIVPHSNETCLALLLWQQASYFSGKTSVHLLTLNWVICSKHPDNWSKTGILVDSSRLQAILSSNGWDDVGSRR